MGEVMPTEQADSSSGSVQPKEEPLPDGYDSTPDASSPDAEVEAPAQSDAPPVVKRKGGRKPIYATSEERKQRNRQAQAAFRERRTEYIKQLEETIKQQEAQLQSLQQSHRSAADECLMLRYKNSLLERLLLEKGIDVQNELRIKSGPTATSNRPATASTSNASPMQRAMMNRQQHVRTNSNVAPLSHQNTAPASHSPTFNPTPSSHQSSPSTGKSPTAYVIQGGISPTSTDMQAQPQMQPRPLQPSQPATFISHTHSGGVPSQSRRPTAPASSQNYHGANTTITAGSFYPTAFQKHHDELEQEYAHDAQADMMIDQHDADSTTETSTSTFPSNFQPPSMLGGFQQQQAPRSQSHPGQHMQPPQPSPTNADPTQQSNIFAHGPGHHLFDPFDAMLDADPFGLTASMHFPTPFTYEHSQHGQVAEEGTDQGGPITG